jgi:hypothetical protein
MAACIRLLDTPISEQCKPSFLKLIEATAFPEMSFRNEVIIIYNIIENFIEANWGDSVGVFKDFKDLLVR